ncbi:hypothetical protein BX666DRAFT_1858985, partial [Dichotomocladium elegans]
ALLDHAQESVLLYPYKNVPVCWRCMIMEASILQAVCLLGETTTAGQQPLETALARKVIRILDVGLIVSGAPGPHRRKVTLKVLQAVQDELTRRSGAVSSSSVGCAWPRRLGLVTSLPEIDGARAVPRLAHVPDFIEFVTRITCADATPFIIPAGAIADWPAMERWGSVAYLLSVAGDRVVPVELGQQYTDQQWQQKLMRFGDFVTDYVLQGKAAYLAQHDLFCQIPALARDIQVPDYCYAEPELVPGLYDHAPPDVIKNAWFGPKGTVSPLHQDPYHNVLAQPVGAKYLRLYAPSQTPYLYPHDGILSNTSQADVEHPDREAFPLLEKAAYFECLLQQGELLYIPPRWWHYVRSLSTSFSVSFWF